MLTEARNRLTKLATGIPGFDEITQGGLPKHRLTVITGGPGAGKTIFAAQVLAERASRHESGILIAFEENAADLLDNLGGFSWGVSVRSEYVKFIDARISQTVVQAGSFDLLGLLAILGAQCKRTGAEIVVFDGIDILLAHLGDSNLARREVVRIAEWLSENRMTGIVTTKADPQTGQIAPEYEFLQFMADCIVNLTHYVDEGTSFRRLRVAKYRGSAHSSNEFSFTIAEAGIDVTSSMKMDVAHPISMERVSTGIERLDAMLDGGYYRGSSVLISGAPGTAKSSLAATFAEAACKRGESTLYVSFDEEPEQIVRNVASIGVHLEPHLKSGKLVIKSFRSRAAAAEHHLANIRNMIREQGAMNLVVDPISALAQVKGNASVEPAGFQILALARSHGVTVLGTTLLSNSLPLSDETPVEISTVADTWMHVSYVSSGGERNRALTIVKSRGTKHSNQVRELVLTESGITLTNVSTILGEVLMGTLRWQKENEARRLAALSEHSATVREREAELVIAETKARVMTLTSQQALHEAELQRIRADRASETDRIVVEKSELLRLRHGDGGQSTESGGLE